MSDLKYSVEYELKVQPLDEVNKKLDEIVQNSARVADGMDGMSSSTTDGVSNVNKALNDFLANLRRTQVEAGRAGDRIDDVGDASQRAGNEVDGFSKKLLALGKAAVAAIAFDAIMQQITGTLDSLAALDDMAQKTGASLENLSKLQQVAVAYGHSFDEMGGMITKFAVTLGGLSLIHI